MFKPDSSTSYLLTSLGAGRWVNLTVREADLFSPSRNGLRFFVVTVNVYHRQSGSAGHGEFLVGVRCEGTAEARRYRVIQLLGLDATTGKLAGVSAESVATWLIPNGASRQRQLIRSELIQAIELRLSKVALGA
jgi:hypothetical protein